ncbi:hypothetical protein K439DRAFT_1637948, partial [Ramaria rubella]
YTLLPSSSPPSLPPFHSATVAPTLPSHPSKLPMIPTRPVRHSVYANSVRFGSWLL